MRLYEASAHTWLPSSSIQARELHSFPGRYTGVARSSCELSIPPARVINESPICSQFILLTSETSIVAGEYYMIHSFDAPSISSFYVQDGQVVLLKMTLQLSEPILYHVLDVLHDALGEEFAPTEWKPWKFVFVVPEDMAETFPAQEVKKPDGFSRRCGGDDSDRWTKLIRQYVVAFDLSQAAA